MGEGCTDCKVSGLWVRMRMVLESWWSVKRCWREEEWGECLTRQEWGLGRKS